MHEDAAGDAVAVDAGEGLSASFGVVDDPPHQEDVEQNHECTPEESPFFANGAEDEVGTLLRNETVGGLGAVEITLSEKSSGAYGYFGLVYVISHTGRVFLHTEQNLDSFPLVVLKDVIEKEVCRKYQQKTGQS